MQTLTIISLLLIHFYSAMANCPTGCLCSSNIIVCTCKGRDSNILNLDPFHSIDYINDVYIHTCDTVKIGADTFASLSILKEFTITDVNHLCIDSFAFREMHKYPDKMTLKNVHMDTIPSDAFAGFSRVQHLWFINITAGVIQENAFRHTNQIEYVYFRESTIDVLETGAFAHMKNIGHLFIRGDCKIIHAYDHLFNASRIDEVILEKCIIHSLSAYAFCGAERLNKLIMNNSTVLKTDLISIKYKYYPIISAGKFEIITTNFDQLSIMPWSNVQEIEFDTCRIEMLMPLQDIIPLTNVTQVQFKRTLVNYITDHSLAGSNMTYLVFEQCSIDTIHYKAFTGSTIEYMSLFNCRLVQFNPNAFTNASIEWFIMDGTIMYYGIHQSAFAFLNSSKILISGSNISNIDKNAFSDLKTTKFDMENCIVGNFSDGALMYLSSDSSNISCNHFVTHMTEDAFKSFMTLKLDFRFNAIACDCGSSESINLMNLRRRTDYWNILNNQCTKETQCPSTITIKKHVTQVTTSLMCQRHYGYILDCWCKSLAAVELRVQDTGKGPFNKNLVGLTLRDCSSINIHRGALDRFRSLTILQLHNISKLNLPSNTLNGLNTHLRQLDIVASHVTDLKPAILQGMKRLKTLTIAKGSYIDTIYRGAFNAANIQQINIDTSKIGLIEEGVMLGTVIGNFTITNTHIGRIDDKAFSGGIVDVMNIKRSNIKSMGEESWAGLDHSRICFSHNQIACDCDIQAERAISHKNLCQSVVSQCHTPAKYSSMTVDQVLQKTRTELNALNSRCGAIIELQTAGYSSNSSIILIYNSACSLVCFILLIMCYK